MIMHLQLERWTSPMCPLLIVTDDDGVLRALEFGDHESRMDRLLAEHYGDHTLDKGSTPASIRRALQAYFDGHLEAIDELPVATGGTPVQKGGWNALRGIPAGN